MTQPTNNNSTPQPSKVWEREFEERFVTFWVKDSNPNENYQEFKRIYELPKAVKNFICQVEKEAEIRGREEVLKEIDEWLDSDEVYDVLPTDGQDDYFLQLWRKKKVALLKILKK